MATRRRGAIIRGWRVRPERANALAGRQWGVYDPAGERKLGFLTKDEAMEWVRARLERRSRR